MRKIHIALRGIAEDIAKELIHDPVMKELCHIAHNEEEDTDAIVVPLADLTQQGVPTLWLTGSVRALVSKDELSAQQMLERTFLLSLVRTVPYRSDMSAEEMSLYDAVLCTSDEEKEAVFSLFPTQAVVAVALNDESVCVAPVRGTDWYIPEEETPGTSPHNGDAAFHTSLDATRQAVYTAVDIVRSREEWDEARENPLPKLFVDKKPQRKEGNLPFKPFDE